MSSRNRSYEYGWNWDRRQDSERRLVADDNCISLAEATEMLRGVCVGGSTYAWSQQQVRQMVPVYYDDGRSKRYRPKDVRKLKVELRAKLEDELRNPRPQWSSLYWPPRAGVTPIGNVVRANPYDPAWVEIDAAADERACRQQEKP